MVAHVASLAHLTGPSSGTTSWLGETSLNVSLDPNCKVHIEAPDENVRGADLAACLNRIHDGFVINAPEDVSIWVNGESIKSKHLQHMDIIEFGEEGPMSRYRLQAEGGLTPQSTVGILRDAGAYFRTSRQPLGRRIRNIVLQIFRRLAVETTMLFRASVVIALVALTALAYQQVRLSGLLQQQLISGRAQLEDFSRTLARSRKEALTPGDLTSLREELDQRIVTASDRLSKLEHLSTATQRIIAESAPSVLFLQGSYGFKDESSGRMMHMMVNSAGQPMQFPNGLPMLSPDGKGPVAERQFVGSGFLVGDKGYLVTNRHVALPWELDGNTKLLALRGFVPVLTKLVAHRPGSTEGEEVVFVEASNETDLALLKYVDPKERPEGLKVAKKAPPLGDEITVMGYPTGLRALIAQAGTSFIEALQSEGDTEFWSVAARLAKSGFIYPLASRGIVGRSTLERVVYDAETTHGGSGGPVLNSNGEVIAVNTAIIPEFGGSNLGVPAQKVIEFLTASEIETF